MSKIRGIGVVKVVSKELDPNTIYYIIQICNGETLHLRDAWASNPFNFAKFKDFINKEVVFEGNQQGKFLFVSKMSLRR